MERLWASLLPVEKELRVFEIVLIFILIVAVFGPKFIYNRYFRVNFYLYYNIYIFIFNLFYKFVSSTRLTLWTMNI